MSTDTGSPRIVTTDQLFRFAGHALEQMIDIVTGLGDELANTRPDLPGANSPYQILTHCLGVVSFWAGRGIAGRAVTRDRDAEFSAAGSPAALAVRAHTAVARLRSDLAALLPGEPLRHPPRPDWRPQGRETEFTQEEALVHILEELYQHLGHLELTRDLLRHRP
ncbi:uncharacterized protein DUF664 [Stackebrandtia albiflava]|uniref:Uncharacterized protein DUF664 n=2 Tax=Stackebrandtia albiflava TaxID=406432 RepID=A0A562VCY7_9ACTN|nr:uncharacterized protein DUF664 [Stackebrandtia albiflava]